MSDTDRQRRADARRARLTLRRPDPGETGHDPHPVRGAEAVELAVRLSEAAWALGGRPWPRYTRAEIPVRIVRDGGT